MEWKDLERVRRGRTRRREVGLVGFKEDEKRKGKKKRGWVGRIYRGREEEERDEVRV